ncbi:DNA repair protein RadC [Candidatus Saccharibacteria bacterium]|nr:DNA repair protein RadC [Candidatus Saccharibacteria bacterium]
MVKIQNIKKDERPREKLQTKGANALSDIELLQVVIGSGIKGADVTKIAKDINKLLITYGYKLNTKQLSNIKGVNQATSSKLVALFELAERYIIKETIIDTVEAAIALVPELKTASQEHLVVLSLDGANRLITKRLVTIGTLNTSLVHPREVFADPLQDRAAGIIVIHNHPSGTLEPSGADIQVTQRLKDAGKLLGINLLDHVIITKKSYCSIVKT